MTELPLSSTISPDAKRQRRCRERRRRGAIVIHRLVLSPTALDGLITLGWLREVDRGDRETVANAFVDFARHALTHVAKAMVASPPR